jgi:acyl transferase domain-containing protein
MPDSGQGFTSGSNCPPSNQIAIIGMGCRLPGAPDPARLWELLRQGGNAITEIPVDRFSVDEFYDPRPATPGKMMSRFGGFLEKIDEFDADFFGISPREAACMDPQQRVLMEVAWEAFEDAGLTLEQTPDLTAGVFMGVITSDYWDRQSNQPRGLDVHTVGGSTRGGNAGRISYALNFRGLSVAVDAACSSSLVAVHLAVQSLRAGSCDVALAGGVNMILNPDHAIGFSQGLMMAPDGQCKAFDARADGYVRSEGAAVVMLKPLAKALADGDRVHAVICGSAVSNDGHGETFMAPQAAGQITALRTAYEDAGVDPSSVAYVEAHGTGTNVGDPVEITALDAVLGEGRTAERPLLVGSVKTNIGHTEGAAGAAGLIKVVLCLKHGWIPASLNFETPNPAIPWEALRIQVADHGQAWPQGTPRRAGVSSFGITGTNVHVVVGQAPAMLNEERGKDVPAVAVLPISARSEAALEELAARYRGMVAQATSDASLLEICRAAALRRTHHDHRLALLCSSREDVVAKLDAYREDGWAEGVYRWNPDDDSDLADGPEHKTVWIFPGQGTQWVGMGRDLLAAEPVFAEAIAACQSAMGRYVDWSLTAELTADEASSRLDMIDVAQPVIFAFQVALAALWRSQGFEPDMLVGHSMGEVAAAHVAGILSLEDAVRIICGRSRLVRSISGKGAMAAVDLSPVEARKLAEAYPGQVSLAVYNAPVSCVVAGAPQAITAIVDGLTERGLFGRRVRVDIASHCPQVDPLREDLLRLADPIQPRPGRVPMWSTVTGHQVRGEELGPQYWADNLRKPVLFADVVQKLAANGFDTFVEFSPHPTLTGAVQQNLQHVKRPGTVVGVISRELPGCVASLAAVAELYAAGRTIDWVRLFPHRGRPVELPTYPWQRERHWKDAFPRDAAHTTRSGGAIRTSGGLRHPLIGTFLEMAPGRHYVWDFELDLRRLPYLSQHCVHGMPVLPGAAYHELALAAAEQICGEDSFRVEDLHLDRARFLPAETPVRMQLRCEPADGGDVLSWQCFAAEDGGNEWVRLAAAAIHADGSSRSGEPVTLPDPAEFPELLDVEEHYAASRHRGIVQSGPFQGIAWLRRAPGHVLAQLSIHDDIASELDGYLLHPALLDSALQPLMALLQDEGSAQDTYLPVTTRRFCGPGRPKPDEALWCHVVRTSPADQRDLVEGNITIVDARGRCILAIEGFQLQRLGSDLPEVLEHKARRLLFGVEWTPLESLSSPETDEGTYLVVDDGRHGEQIHAQLAKRGAVALMVGRATRPRTATDRTLDVGSVSAWERLITEQIHAGRWPLRGVIYVCEPAEPAEVGSRQLEDGFGIVCLVQALAATATATLPRLWIVTCGGQAVVESDTNVAPARTATWGLGRVIRYEHPDLRCSLVDLPVDPGEDDLHALCAEIATGGSEDELALRMSRRYACRLRPQALPDSSKDLPIRPDATYLIAGGLSGVGLLSAEWLIGRGARHLVLTGRTGVPQHATARIKAMSAAGAEVRVFSVDISHRAAVADLLGIISQEMPPLRGIINSAVVLDDATLVKLNRNRFFSVMPPKVDGSWHLHELTRDLPMDFFVLYSSAASLIGSPGQGNYAVANAYVDGLAHHRRGLGLPALGINWGHWRNTGRVAKADRDLRLEERGFAGFEPHDAFAILGQLLTNPPAQASVMSFHPPTWIQHYPALRTCSLFQDLDTSADAGSEQPEFIRATVADHDADRAHQALVAYLCAKVAAIVNLPTERVQARSRLHRLGVDSLMAVQLRNRIAADLEVTLPLATFLQHRTIAQLARVLLDQLVPMESADLI